MFASEGDFVIFKLTGSRARFENFVNSVNGKQRNQTQVCKTQLYKYGRHWVCKLF